MKPSVHALAVVPALCGVADELREYADRIERGEIFALVMAVETRDQFEYYAPCRPHDAVRLSDLLHYSCLKDFVG